MAVSTTPASFNISDFREKIGTIVRPNLWYASIVSTGIIGPQSSVPNFSFRCESSTIPGRTVATIDDVGSGPALKIPYDVNYADHEITVICSSDMAERKYFEGWIDNIVTKTGRVKYHEKYAKGKKLELHQINEAGITLIKYTLNDIYPIQISPMNLSWEETNTYQRFTVTLSYRNYDFS